VSAFAAHTLFFGLLTTEVMPTVLWYNPAALKRAIIPHSGHPAQG